MNAIVMNTLSAAVTEYSNFDFQSITPTHAGGATGLFLLGGDTDLDAPIVGEIKTPVPLRESTLKKHVEMLYFSMKGAGAAEATVFGETQNWTYSFPVRSPGQSRCQPGRGIRENYLGFGFRKPDGRAFTIDRIEVLMRESKTRRV